MNAQSTQSTVQPSRFRAALASFGEKVKNWLGPRHPPEKKQIQTWEGEGGNLAPQEPASTQQPKN